MQIYNSLTKMKEELIPLSERTINMYTCGVTVYDRCHLGHARSLYVFDVIRRYLKFRGFHVRLVRNITDVDDKIIQRAQQLNLSAQEVAQRNVALYYEDLKRLKVARADFEPRATEYIPQMVEHISQLMAAGYAYLAGGSVYFNVRKFKEYGRLSKQSVEKMLEATRIEKDEDKKDPLDFVLWKESKPGEPAWESPWGQGRPGWHIECTVMSLKLLGCRTLDIHAGGRDLIFPHHENEIAQAEAVTQAPFARYWIHHGLLTINGQKMAKSLGNYISVEEALNRYPLDDLKLFFLFSHYASPMDFTEEKMLEAHKANERFDILFWKACDLLKDQEEVVPQKEDFIERQRHFFMEAMDDDFNTPRALAALFDLVNDTNKFIDQRKTHAHYYGVIFEAVETLEELTQTVLGLFVEEEEVHLTKEEEGWLEERIQARRSKDFKRSDELRDLLRAKGIAVEDAKDGQRWRKL